jgi:predicted nicotinamide N-methyase
VEPPVQDAVLFALLDAHAPWGPTPLTPALAAWRADDELPLWQALEAAAGRPLPPPFFCVPWPAAQALALAILAGRIDVRGRRIAEVGAGSGLVCAAAMRAGASAAMALDVDPLAGPAAGELARRNESLVAWRTVDALRDPSAIADADVVIAADAIYESQQREAVREAARAWRRRSRLVLADSGRPFFDPCGLPLLDRYEVPVPTRVEGATTRTVLMYTRAPCEGCGG